LLSLSVRERTKPPDQNDPAAFLFKRSITSLPDILRLSPLGDPTGDPIFAPEPALIVPREREKPGAGRKLNLESTPGHWD